MTYNQKWHNHRDGSNKRDGKRVSHVRKREGWIVAREPAASARKRSHFQQYAYCCHCERTEKFR